MADRYQSRPYPTDDDYHRGNDPYAPQSAESDPLAELARLIGQTDPFGNGGMSRANLQPQPRPVAREQYHPPIEAEEEQSPASPPPWMQRANRHEAPQPDYPSQHYPAQNYSDQSYPDPEQAYQAHPGFDGTDQDHSTQAYPDQDYASAEHPLRRRYAVQHPEPAHEDYPQESSFQQAEQSLDPSRYDDALFGPFDSGEAVQYPQAYSDDPYSYQDGYGEEAEEEAPKRRGGLTTVVAVLALAVIGTGAAFAYRTYIGSPRNGEPPIIKADTSPTKIIPASASDGSKAPDRLASADGTEKIVPREEAPVDVNANVNSGPRTVFPPPNQSQNPPMAASVTPGAAPSSNFGNGLMPNSQPRPIKTLTVSGDDADAANASAQAPTPQPPASKPAPPVRTVRTAPASTAAAYASANAPLSLAPQSVQSTPPSRQVATNAPEPIAPSTPSTTSSGYMVQVSSQRNETDAQASYRVLQGKFPTVLGSRSPTIRKADLGEKGIYYRAMVGPFGSAEEASQFCGSLKSAGGQCVIQRN
jgi:hypothetical protein